jgi:hypothetical protein
MWRSSSRRDSKQASCAVKVLSAERTFWEKATILHAEFHRPADKPMPERFSRHYCDFYELIRKGVANQRRRSRNCWREWRAQEPVLQIFWAKYGEAVKGHAADRAAGTTIEGVAG